MDTRGYPCKCPVHERYYRKAVLEYHRDVSRRCMATKQAQGRAKHRMPAISTSALPRDLSMGACSKANHKKTRRFNTHP